MHERTRAADGAPANTSIETIRHRSGFGNDLETEALPGVVSLGQYRWDPLLQADEPSTWLTGMRTMATAGDVGAQSGTAAHVYLVTASMENAYFHSADSELLVVPQQGRLRFRTELNVLDVDSQEIALLPHGPDRTAFERVSNAELAPQKLENTMSFMFETRFAQRLTAFATTEAPLQDDYVDCWADLERKFDGTPEGRA